MRGMFERTPVPKRPYYIFGERLIAFYPKHRIFPLILIALLPTLKLEGCVILLLLSG